MRKKIISLITTLFVLTLLFGNTQNSFCQEKQKEKKKKEQKTGKKSKKKGVKGGVIGGVEGGVIGGVKGGVQGGVAGGVIGGVMGGVTGGVFKRFDEDFILKPKKIIELNIEHLEIRPTETIPLRGVVRLKTESGKFVKYEISSPSLSLENIQLELKPVIVEPKGIEMMIQISHGAKVLQKKSILTKNLESVIVELMRNKDASIKLVDKITPIIQVVMPPLAYPQPINEIKIVRHIFFMNDEFISRGGISSARAESEDSQIFLHFWIKGKGLYLLSFQPFEKAEPLGVVRNNIIRIKHEEDYFEWISMEPILPVGAWRVPERKFRVWVRHNPDYDPLSIFPEKDREKIQKYYERSQKEFDFMDGVTSGSSKKILKRFFK